MLEWPSTLTRAISYTETSGSTARGCMVGACLPTLQSPSNTLLGRLSPIRQVGRFVPVFQEEASRGVTVPKGRAVGMVSMSLEAVSQKQLGHPK